MMEKSEQAPEKKRAVHGAAVRSSSALCSNRHELIKHKETMDNAAVLGLDRVKMISKSCLRNICTILT